MGAYKTGSIAGSFTGGRVRYIATAVMHHKTESTSTKRISSRPNRFLKPASCVGSLNLVVDSLITRESRRRSQNRAIHNLILLHLSSWNILSLLPDERVPPAVLILYPFPAVRQEVKNFLRLPYRCAPYRDRIFHSCVDPQIDAEVWAQGCPESISAPFRAHTQQAR